MYARVSAQSLAQGCPRRFPEDRGRRQDVSALSLAWRPARKDDAREIALALRTPACSGQAVGHPLSFLRVICAVGRFATGTCRNALVFYRSKCAQIANAAPGGVCT